MSHWYRVLNPKSLLDSLGGLHDARITRLEWLPSRQQLTITVDDVYSNFLGLPEYKAVGSASFSFVSVSKLQIEIDPTRSIVSIYEMRVHGAQLGMLDIRIDLAPGGAVNLVCESLDIDKVLNEVDG